MGAQMVVNVHGFGTGPGPSGFPGSESSRRNPTVTAYVVHGASPDVEAVKESLGVLHISVRATGGAIVSAGIVGGGSAIGSEKTTVMGESSGTREPEGENLRICGGVESIWNIPLSSQYVAPDRFVAVTFTITSGASTRGTVQGICPSRALPAGTVRSIPPMSQPAGFGVYRHVAFTRNTSVAVPALVTTNRIEWTEPPVHDSPPSGETREIDVTRAPPAVKKCLCWQSESGFPGSLMSVAVQAKVQP